ncbi:hypothetical protein CEXT_637461 [Caerostris extrusa]|uniref:Uncharacterized protein n=1 Tax=Caerostris extrusa TaxID=172846 RepID=A0AAV4NBV3_CAEEX|nr:hypothetical protein CEXT_637461 [Caerostris extrusa]
MQLRIPLPNITQPSKPINNKELKSFDLRPFYTFIYLTPRHLLSRSSSTIPTLSPPDFKSSTSNLLPNKSPARRQTGKKNDKKEGGELLKEDPSFPPPC